MPLGTILSLIPVVPVLSILRMVANSFAIVDASDAVPGALRLVICVPVLYLVPEVSFRTTRWARLEIYVIAAVVVLSDATPPTYPV